MAVQTSLQEVLEGPRLLAGEEHLRSGAPDLNPGASPAAQTEAPAHAVKTGDQSATPAQTETPKPPATADKRPSDDIWSDPEGENIPRQVYVATRNKWRDKADEAGRQLAELRGQLSVLQQQRQQPQIQQPSQQVDPDAPFYEKGPAAFVQEQLGSVKDSVQKVLFQDRVARSLHRVQREHADYAEVEGAFFKALTPHLKAQLEQHPEPAEFVYEHGKTLMELGTRGVSSLSDLRKQIEDELRPQIEADLKKKSALAAAEQASTSSAGARGSGATSSPVFSGRTPLGKIVKGSGL
jgi:hypothetical protein